MDPPQVTALHGDDRLAGVTLTTRDGSDGQRSETIDTRALFVMIGAAPNTDWLGGHVALDDRGFVRTGRDAGPEQDGYATSCPGVFAVGDVRSGSVKRVASAVGEGSVVVSAIHAWLAKSRSSV